jgi:hypothetical protein
VPLVCVDDDTLVISERVIETDDGATLDLHSNSLL